MNRKAYPSDISREQFMPLLPLLESAVTHSATSDGLVRCLVPSLYLLRSGCAWRALPGDFPQMAHRAFLLPEMERARENGISLLEEALKKSGSCGAPQAGAP